MDTNMADAVEFLCSNFMDSSQVNMESLVGSFLKEMERGLEGTDSSLMMIPTFVRGADEIPADTPVIALDAGGTNLRVALVSFDGGGRPTIRNFRKYPMPGVEKEIDSQAFFSSIAEHLDEVAGASESVGFCFSYPTEILENLDGRLVRFTKEIKAKDVEGRLIGESLNEAMAARGLKRKKIVILNDTVATLLAGKSADLRLAYDSYIGFILGTGTNCAYIEQARRFGKAGKADLSPSQIINVESGGFAAAPRGFIDREYDSGMVDPGRGTFEKMISGAYLGGLYSAVLAKASEGGLFSKEGRLRLAETPRLDTRELAAFLSNPGERGGALPSALSTRGDVAVAYCLAERIVDRAAKLSAANLAAMAVKSGKGQDPQNPILITADGTTFYEMPGLGEKTRMYLGNYLFEHSGQKCRFAKVEDAPLIGAAIAGLTR